jgi:hypothetical protein
MQPSSLRSAKCVQPDGSGDFRTKACSSNGDVSIQLYRCSGSLRFGVCGLGGCMGWQVPKTWGIRADDARVGEDFWR